MAHRRRREPGRHHAHGRRRSAHRAHPARHLHRADVGTASRRCGAAGPGRGAALRQPVPVRHRAQPHPAHDHGLRGRLPHAAHRAPRVPHHHTHAVAHRRGRVRGQHLPGEREPSGARAGRARDGVRAPPEVVRALRGGRRRRDQLGVARRLPARRRPPCAAARRRARGTAVSAAHRPRADVRPRRPGRGPRRRPGAARQLPSYALLPGDVRRGRLPRGRPTRELERRHDRERRPLRQRGACQRACR